MSPEVYGNMSRAYHFGRSVSSADRYSSSASHWSCHLRSISGAEYGSATFLTSTQTSNKTAFRLPETKGHALAVQFYQNRGEFQGSARRHDVVATAGMSDSSRAIQSKLVTGARELGLDLGLAEVASFTLFQVELLDWNRRIN